jgi:hypothetical protein
LNEIQRVEMARALAERLLKFANDDNERLDRLFLLLTSRSPTDLERRVCMELLQSQRERYAASEDDAHALLMTGDVARDESLPVADHAAWTQVTTAVLASDAAILLY